MKKIGFVIPWYSHDISGGAEMELRGLMHHLQESGVKLEVLTTCVKDFLSDWSKNYYQEGMTVEHEIVTRRFPVKKRDKVIFNQINSKLMGGEKISKEDEKLYMDNMIHSPKLYEFIKENEEEFSLFVFIPYMFGTTYEGLKCCPEKSVLIPCLHDESYAYMNIYAECFEKIKAMIFHAKPEALLANQIFDLSNVKNEILGEGVSTDIESDAARFIEKYKIREPFMLYVGRKDTTKNVDTLIKYFTYYKKYNYNPCKLVMIGPASLPIPKEMNEDIIDLGFVDLQDKYDAMAAATVLCQPSMNESFSLVIMESWLCETPVIVHNKCEVTKNFAIESNGGLYFENYFEFEKELNFYIQNERKADKMGLQGKEYVMDNFAWDVIVEKYMTFFEECLQDK